MTHSFPLNPKFLPMWPSLPHSPNLIPLLPVTRSLIHPISPLSLSLPMPLLFPVAAEMLMSTATGGAASAAKARPASPAAGGVASALEACERGGGSAGERDGGWRRERGGGPWPASTRKAGSRRPQRRLVCALRRSAASARKSAAGHRDGSGSALTLWVSRPNGPARHD